MVSRKSAHPYDYMDSTTKFKETELPLKEESYSKLNDSDISHDYEHAKRVWKEFKMKRMGDYNNNNNNNNFI